MLADIAAFLLVKYRAACPVLIGWARKIALCGQGFADPLTVRTPKGAAVVATDLMLVDLTIPEIIFRLTHKVSSFLIDFGAPSPPQRLDRYEIRRISSTRSSLAEGAKSWWFRSGSNRDTAGYEPTSLPIETRNHIPAHFGQEVRWGPFGHIRR